MNIFTDSHDDHGEHAEHLDIAEHAEHSGVDGLLEVMFGFEHVVAEFFWNGIFVALTFFITRGFALRKAHKYIDTKHGIEHDEGY
jgi:hypothetical protein